ncbi:MAG: DUF411 domain-containing protein [Phaeospirillum sp.]|nr:DUF411 domain-containing protein [Phaeospirillum sp.]
MNRRVLGIVAVLGLGGAIAFAAFQPSPVAAREAVVYKNPQCGCCKGWATYLQRNGYKVTVIDVDNMEDLKRRLQVPDSLHSCHTAKIDGYVVEGHVPEEATDKLLTKRPSFTGIASPGMPSGSPGMDGPKEDNVVKAFGPGGIRVFGTY